MWYFKLGLYLLVFNIVVGLLCAALLHHSENEKIKPILLKLQDYCTKHFPPERRERIVYIIIILALIYLFINGTGYIEEYDY